MATDTLRYIRIRLVNSDVEVHELLGGGDRDADLTIHGRAKAADTYSRPIV